ncbi:hypothetical protein [Mesorhizobium sp. M4B.F.Ca.ET.058.02.1.1]|uniref:hypothetical protein n=1 Tax=Mesorhizobium sp. M4B.F.Ca.ET.058.02.1.1 TaxID=2493675 RepID=UPI000F75642C|nr:hypothetical protein [Mesorhizobium sp. M4B.F.Ca.ET.058.02.1.1]AZO48022.1 hypothetical protein EJ073_09475 [Mesorhizobium sp. M4B.F.Ca.ET.058.02.1.1]TJX67554.1 MAG: hypothetical protein E5W21_09775 [Mesorhizobium sp.]
MPKFKVTKCVDAFQHFSIVVEAENAEAAVELAKEDDDILDWVDDGVTTYDDVDWENIEPELVP